MVALPGILEVWQITFRYNNDEDKLEAAKKTAELWNTGKVIYTGYGD